MLGGYDLTKTSYLADASSGVGQIIFGDWANAMLAYFGAVDITIDPYSAKKTGQIEISMTQFADFNLAQPAAFAFENGVAIS
jgi:HK97 family phage major capsid protein